jgi:hypothetical protein
MSSFFRWVSIFVLFFPVAGFSAVQFSMESISLQRFQIQEEMIIALKTSRLIVSPEDLHLESSFREVRNLIGPSSWEVLLSRQAGDSYRTLLLWKASDQRNLRQRLGRLEALSQVEWVKPNYQYEGEPREFVRPKDPLFSRQLHHEIIQSPLAWLISLGSSEVIVAVTDDGVDIDHEDLRDSIWINPGEIAGNGIDDDNNGYIDDVYGWDFSSNDNDPRPVSSWSGGDHGTHVAGIIAAANNSVGVIGVAPKVKIMPIRFYGSGPWTSAIIAKSYAYAVDNGAKIISTSYSIDFLVNDPVFREAVAYVYDNGVLHFNSAGNANALNPKRQQIEELILVCSTEVKEGFEDRKSSFSNFGRGIDICAPGSDIWSTVPGNQYAKMSGTSMAAPMAAAVAALIWSVHPNWTRDQVAARLFQSAHRIDELNPSWSGLLGAGRVHAFSSIAFKPTPPRVKRVELNLSAGRIQSLSLISRDVFSQATFEGEPSWSLTHEDGETFDLSLKNPYRIATNEIVLDLSRRLKPGRYDFRLFFDRWKDPFGQSLELTEVFQLDGDFVFSFIVD